MYRWCASKYSRAAVTTVPAPTGYIGIMQITRTFGGICTKEWGWRSERILTGAFEKRATIKVSKVTQLESVSFLATEIVKVLDAESRETSNNTGWHDPPVSAESCESPQRDSKSVSGFLPGEF